MKMFICFFFFFYKRLNYFTTQLSESIKKLLFNKKLLSASNTHKAALSSANSAFLQVGHLPYIQVEQWDSGACFNLHRNIRSSDKRTKRYVEWNRGNRPCVNVGNGLCFQVNMWDFIYVLKGIIPAVTCEFNSGLAYVLLNKKRFHVSIWLCVWQTDKFMTEISWINIILLQYMYLPSAHAVFYLFKDLLPTYYLISNRFLFSHVILHTVHPSSLFIINRKIRPTKFYYTKNRSIQYLIN